MEHASPEHDVLVALAAQYQRQANQPAYDAIREAIRRTDAERFATELASPTCTLVIDRWQDGWIVDTYDLPRAAEVDANRRNTRNVADGQADLRARLAPVDEAAAWAEVAGPLVPVQGGA